MFGLRRMMFALAVAGLALWTNQARTFADDTKKPMKSDQVAMPAPAEVQSLIVAPTAITLKGQDDSAQLVVTGQLAARKQDLSGDVKYEVANPALARVTSSGRVMPLANGRRKSSSPMATKRPSFR